MIPLSYITQWSESAPWIDNKMIEQDLIICRALVSIYTDPFLSEHLAFRGGTTDQLRPRLSIDPLKAWEKVRDEIIVKLIRK